MTNKITLLAIAAAVAALAFADPSLAVLGTLPLVGLQTVPPGSGEQTPPGGGEPLAWLGTNVPPELAGYVQNKGWKNSMELAVGYQNLEKAVGANKVVLPKGDDDHEGYARVFDALGRPKTADEYGIKAPEGGSETFTKAAAEHFHKIGLSKKQAGAMAEWYNTYAGDAQKAIEAAEAQAVQADEAKLKTEWGGAYFERVEAAKRAARTFGLDPDTQEKFQKALGFSGAMKFLHTIGAALGEHKVEGDGKLTGDVLTPAQAKAEIERLKQDKEWIVKYQNGDVEKRNRMEQLHKWLAA